MYEVSCLSRFAQTSPKPYPRADQCHSCTIILLSISTELLPRFAVCWAIFFKLLPLNNYFNILFGALSVGLAVTWLGSPWPLSLTKVILASMTHTNAHMENVVHEYSFPKFGGIMSHFLFSFTTCVIRCGVARFDLGPLSLGLGPHHPPALPCPWTLSLDRVILAYCSLPVPEYEWHYYTSALLNVLHISHGCLYSGTMCTSGWWPIVARRSRAANVLFSNHVTASHHIIVCNCVPPSWALRGGRHKQLHKGRCGTKALTASIQYHASKNTEANTNTYQKNKPMH